MKTLHLVVGFFILSGINRIWAIVLNYIHYVKNHQILVESHTRLYGILFTLCGWFLVALDIVAFQPQNSPIPQSFSFFISFTTGTLFLFIFSKFFSVSLSVNASTDEKHKTHFNVRTRKALIGVRAIFAVISYMGLVYAKNELGIVDDSAIYGADALVYALLMWWILGEKRSKLDWIGIVIATLGISIPFVLNAFSDGALVSFRGGLLGLLSSICLSIIFFMNCVLVRHEPATRIAFYQFLFGMLLSLIICLFSLKSIVVACSNLNWFCIKNSVVGGLLFALALLCFFRAFLYTEVILIAVTGYALDPLAVFLDHWINNELITFFNISTILLICIGTAILYYEEHRQSLKRRNIRVTQPIYEPTIAEEFEKNDQKYQRGEITVDTYRAKRKLFNDLLFKISDEMIDTDINKIELEKGLVYFSLFDSQIRLECGEDLQATPLEVLNFGTYWKDELNFIFELFKNQSCFIDFGAQVGWLSLNISKKFPDAKIFSFEANFDSYSHLIRNIKNNDCLNVEAIHFRLSNRKEKETFFLLPEENILTSEKNALIYSELNRIDCELIPLDQFVKIHKLSSIDFIAGHSVGNELEILQGAQKTLQKYQPLLFLELFEDFLNEFETTTADLMEFLKLLGYEGYHLKAENSRRKESRLPNEVNPYYFFFHIEAHKNLLTQHQHKLFPALTLL